MNEIETFTSLRPLLHSLAYQILGNEADAKDMVQECFLRWDSAPQGEVRSPKAYLTTVITRLCLKHLQSPRVHREHCFGGGPPDFPGPEPAADPADHERLADSLSLALQVLLQTLSPTERVVFLLREVFDCDYGEIAATLDKSEENCRQILRRARERIAGRQSRFEVTPQARERTLDQFLQAAATGDWRELTAMLSAEATLVSDGADLAGAAPAPVRGAAQVAWAVVEKAAAWLPSGARLEPILLGGHRIIVAFQDRRPVSAILATFSGERISCLCVFTCPIRLRSILAPACLRAEA